MTDSFDLNDEAVAISAVAYLGAIALTPPHAPDSESPGARIVHYATVHRGQLLASDLLFALGVVGMVFAAGLYGILGGVESEDGWPAPASLASAVAGAGIFGGGTALFMVVAYRPATDPALARRFGTPAGWPTTPPGSRLWPGSRSSP